MNAQLVGGKMPKLEKVQRKLNLHFVHFCPLWLNAFDKLVSMVWTLTTTSGTICFEVSKLCIGKIYYFSF